MRPLYLVDSGSQDAAANAGVLSVYLITILYYCHQLFIDIERENILYYLLQFFIDIVSIHCVTVLDLLATINLY